MTGKYTSQGDKQPGSHNAGEMHEAGRPGRYTGHQGRGRTGAGEIHGDLGDIQRVEEAMIGGFKHSPYRRRSAQV